MALLSFSALAGTGFGPAGAGWIEANARFEWRWIQWFHAMQVFTTILLLNDFSKYVRSVRRGCALCFSICL
jgi:hypothetical protein